jgi:Lon protease-like protein
VAVRLPLFPLNTVLFPHMPAGLHVFEDRYREMIRDCRELGTSFGVVAIREGLEVGAGALTFGVGTLAQIRELEALDDGGFNLIVAGASRFRVESLSLNRTYLVGRIHYLEDTRGDEAAIPELARRAVLAFDAYRAGLRNLADEPGDDGVDAELPDDPELLSYLIAASLNVELSRRQELLEEDSVSGRLRKCLQVLRREAVFLDQMLARRDNHVVPVSLN